MSHLLQSCQIILHLREYHEKMFDYGSSTRSSRVRSGLARAAVISRHRDLRGHGRRGSVMLDMEFAEPSDDGASSHTTPLEDRARDILEVRREEEEQEGTYHDQPEGDPWLIATPRVEAMQMYVQ